MKLGISREEKNVGTKSVENRVLRKMPETKRKEGHDIRENYIMTRFIVGSPRQMLLVIKQKRINGRGIRRVCGRTERHRGI